MRKTFKFEKRGYESGSTPEEIEALKGLTYIIEDNIIYRSEPPVSTIFQEGIVFAEVDRITQDIPQYYLVIDLSDSEIPSTELKRYLKMKHSLLQDRIMHAAFVTSKNKIMSNMMRFILNPTLGNIPVTVHKSYDAALSYTRKLRQKNLQSK